MIGQTSWYLLKYLWSTFCRQWDYGEINATPNPTQFIVSGVLSQNYMQNYLWFLFCWTNCARKKVHCLEKGTLHCFRSWALTDYFKYTCFSHISSTSYTDYIVISLLISIEMVTYECNTKLIPQQIMTEIFNKSQLHLYKEG